MTPERLAEIRDIWVWRRTLGVHPALRDLLDYIDQLTGERDRARDLVARSGYFINTKDEIRP